MANLNSDYLDQETKNKLDDQKVIGRPLTQLADWELNKIVGALDDAIIRTTEDLGGEGPIQTTNLADVGGAVNTPLGLAKLNAAGVLENTVIPSLAITNSFAAADEAAMLALSDAELGDIAVRADTADIYMLIAADYTQLASWKKIETTTFLSGYFANGGDTAGADRSLGNLDNFDLSILTSGLPRLHIEGGGNIGVGTETPDSKVRINYAGNDGLKMVGDTDQIYLGTTSGVASVGVLNDVAFSVVQNGGAVISIDADQKVGVGTSAPAEKLHVFGGNIELEYTGSPGIFFTNAATSYGRVQGVSSTDAVITGTAAGDLVVAVDPAAQSLHFGNVGDDAIYATIDGTGRLGVGTTAPAEKLHVSGGSILLDNNYSLNWKDDGGNLRTGVYWNSSNELKLYSGTDNTEKITIQADGDVGVGTNAPVEKLTVEGVVAIRELGSNPTAPGAEDNYGRLFVRDDDQLYFMDDTGTVTNLTQVGGEGPIAAAGWTDDGVNVRLTTISNSVGIGIASPASKLHVIGETRLSDGATSMLKVLPGSTSVNQDYRSHDDTGYISAIHDATQFIWQITDSEKMRLSTSGFLGIGVGDPAHRLEVRETAINTPAATFTHTQGSNAQTLRLNNETTPSGGVGSTIAAYSGDNSELLGEIAFGGAGAAGAGGIIYLSPSGDGTGLDTMVDIRPSGVYIGANAAATKPLTFSDSFNFIGTAGKTAAGSGADFGVYAGFGDGLGNAGGDLLLGSGRGNNSATNGDILFGVSNSTESNSLGSQHMVIRGSDGFVGIGVTAPTQKLEILGATDDVSGVAFVRSSDSIAVDKGGSIAFGGYYTSGGAVSPWGMVKGAKENATDGNADGYLAFYTHPNGGAMQERMRIDSTGRVGIGNIDSSYKLNINGSAKLTPGTHGAYVIAQNAQGEDAQLAIQPPGTWNAANPVWWVGKSYQYNSPDFHIGTYINDPGAISNAKLTILADGKIGIGGVLTPSDSLHVGGNLRVNGVLRGDNTVAAGGVFTAIDFDGTSNGVQFNSPDGTEALNIQSGVTYTTDNFHARGDNIPSLGGPSNRFNSLYIGTGTVKIDTGATIGGDIIISNGQAIRSGVVEGASLISRGAGAAAAITIGSGQVGDSLEFVAGGSVKATLTTGGNLSASAVPTAGSHLTNKDYVDGLAQGLDWQESVLDRTTNALATQTLGNRYISTDTSGGWTVDYIYEWDGAAWIETIPDEGTCCWVEDEDTNYVYNGGWVKFGSTVTHNNTSGLQGGVASEYYHLSQTHHSSLTGGGTTGLHHHGWQHVSPTVRLTTSTDQVSIGLNTPDAGTKVHIRAPGGTSALADARSKSGLWLNEAGGWGMAFGQFTGTLDSYIQSMNTDQSSVAKLTLNPYGGLVGIGTATPTYNLEVQENDTLAAATLVVRNLGTGDSTIGFQTASANNYSIGIDNSDADKLKIARNVDDVSVNTALTIDTLGLVGIGTSAPTSVLHINGEVANGAALFVENSHILNDAYTAAEILNKQSYNFASGDIHSGLIVRLEADKVTGADAGASQGYGVWVKEPVLSNGAQGYASYSSFFTDVDADGAHSTNTNAYSFRSTGTAWMYHAGSVGIGNDSPTIKLTVNNDDGVAAVEHGLATFERGTGATSTGVILGYRADGAAVTGGSIRSLNFKPLFLGTGSSQKAVTITDAGGVGIGTDDPVAQLNSHVNGTQGYPLGLTNNTLKATVGGYIGALYRTADVSNPMETTLIQFSGAAATDRYFQIQSGDGLQYYNIALAPLGGRVGVGTASINSGNKLQVSGAVSSPYFRAESFTEDYTVAVSNEYSAWAEYDNAGNRTEYARIAMLRTGTTTGNYDGEIAFVTRLTGQSGAEAMRIDKNQNVGIGTTTPAANLHLNALNSPTMRFSRTNDAAATSQVMYIQAASPNASSNLTDWGGIRVIVNDPIDGTEDSKMTFDTMVAGSITETMVLSEGKLGIGTSTPDSSLDVVNTGTGADNTILTLQSDSSTPAANDLAMIDFKFSDAGGNQDVMARIGAIEEDPTEGTEDGGLVFYTRAAGGSVTEKVRIRSDGNIGVGVTNPTAKLEIGGTPGVDGIKFPDGTTQVSAAVAGQRYTENVGNNSDVNIVVNHALGTRDVIVQVYRNSSPWDNAIVEFERTDANNITLKFASAPTTDQYRVVVTG